MIREVLSQEISEFLDAADGVTLTEARSYEYALHTLLRDLETEIENVTGYYTGVPDSVVRLVRDFLYFIEMWSVDRDYPESLRTQFNFDSLQLQDDWEV